MTLEVSLARTYELVKLHSELYWQSGSSCYFRMVLCHSYPLKNRKVWRTSHDKRTALYLCYRHQDNTRMACVRSRSSTTSNFCDAPWPRPGYDTWHDLQATLQSSKHAGAKHNLTQNQDSKSRVWSQWKSSEAISNHNLGFNYQGFDFRRHSI